VKLGLALALVLLVLAVVRTFGLTRANPERRSPSSGPDALLAFSLGDRVAVSPKYSWAQGAVATVAAPPERVREIAGDWNGVSRIVQGVMGPMTYSWVNFDVPQFDADGDGPFFGAEIESSFLRPGPAAVAYTPRVSEDAVEAIWYENERLGKRVEFKAYTKP